MNAVRLHSVSLSRRDALRWGVAAGAALLPAPLAHGAAEAPLREFALAAGPAGALLQGEGGPITPAWGYDRQVPGPALRVRQGDRLRIVFTNRLDRPTALYFHGLRLPQALNWRPLQPGESFAYEFVARDAGTFWYRPSPSEPESQARGLAGALVVAEAAPIAVDRDLVWLLQDWRLRADAALMSDFGRVQDRRGQGRLGAVITLNGDSAEPIMVRARERLRLRLVNASVARSYALKVEGHRAVVIAYDGQPVTPHYPYGGVIPIAPGQRVDAILDMNGAPGEIYGLIDDQDPRNSRRLLEIAYRKDERARDRAPDGPLRLPPNRLPEPRLRDAERHEVVIEGPNDPPRALWTFNGRRDARPEDPPLLALRRRTSHIVALRNVTALDHPIHLQGHVFRVLRRNGERTAYREWRDTVVVRALETVEIGFVAGAPGDWMIGSGVLDHRAAGLVGIVRVG